jgi:Surface antigen variable number repeat
MIVAARWLFRRRFLMSRMLITAVAVKDMTGCGQTRPEPDQDPLRVGELRIIGNTVTPDRFIRARVEIYPGQRFSAADLVKAEWALALAGFDALVVPGELIGFR